MAVPKAPKSKSWWTFPLPAKLQRGLFGRAPRPTLLSSAPSPKPSMGIKIPHLRIWILVLSCLSQSGSWEGEDWWLQVLATTCLTLIIANILTIQFTIICMLDPEFIGGEQVASSNDSANGFRFLLLPQISLVTQPRLPATSPTHGTEAPLAASSSCSPDGIHGGPRLRWSKAVQSTIYSAFSWGSLIATLPISWLLQHYGTRRILTVIGLISALATALSPLAAYGGYVLFIGCRIAMGVCYTCLFPAIGAITTHWATLGENGLFMGMLGSATQLAPVVAMPISGALCSSRLGWPAVFYAQGALTLAAFGALSALYRNKPRKHPWILPEEIAKIDAGKPALVNREDPPIPYRAILKSVPIWAALAATLSNMCGSQMVLLFTPTYLNSVLRFDIGQVALLSTLPTLFQFFVKFLGGYVSDQLPWGDTVKVKLFNSLALFGMAVFLVFLALVPPERQYLALSMLVAAMAFLGFHSGGFFKAVTLMSMEFAPIVMGLVTLIDVLIWLVTPYVIAAAAPSDSFAEWQSIFYGCSGLLFVTGLVFILFGSGQTEAWALNAQKFSIIHANSTAAQELIDMSKEELPEPG